jgi:hypothetical protein
MTTVLTIIAVLLVVQRFRVGEAAGKDARASCRELVGVRLEGFRRLLLGLGRGSLRCS